MTRTLRLWLTSLFTAVTMVGYWQRHWSVDLAVHTTVRYGWNTLVNWLSWAVHSSYTGQIRTKQTHWSVDLAVHTTVTLVRYGQNRHWSHTAVTLWVWVRACVCMSERRELYFYTNITGFVLKQNVIYRYHEHKSELYVGYRMLQATKPALRMETISYPQAQYRYSSYNLNVNFVAHWKCSLYSLLCKHFCILCTINICY